MSEYLSRKPHITAFITGAAGGIANALLDKISEKYNGVLGLADRNAKGLEALKLNYERDDLSIKTFAFDLSDTGQLKNAINETCSGGGLDLLFNNAGVMTNHGGFESGTLEQVETSIGVNFSAVANACHIAWPSLKENKGCVINNASGAGRVPFPHDAVYGASKAATIMLTESLALRRDESRIRFNAICPGVVDTPILIDPDTQTYFEATKQFMSSFELIQPSEIADAVLSQFEDATLNGDIRSISNKPKVKS